MANTFDVEVVGIDLSVNMISFALEQSIGLQCNVEFEVADCTTKTYPDNSFDVIYSRDTILHIQVRPHPFLRPLQWKRILLLKLTNLNDHFCTLSQPNEADCCL